MAFLSLERLVRSVLPIATAVTITLPSQVRAQEVPIEPNPSPAEEALLDGIPPLIPITPPEVEPVQPPTTKPLNKNLCPTAGDCSKQGSAALAEGDYHRAIDFFEEGLRHPIGPVARSTLYFNLATAKEHAGRPSDALTFFKLYLKGGKNNLNPERAEYVRQKLPGLELYAMGRNHFDNKRYTDALTAYKNAMTVYPAGTTPTTLCIEIVRTYDALGNLEGAIEHIEHCVEMEPIPDRKQLVTDYRGKLIGKRKPVEVAPPQEYVAEELKLGDESPEPDTSFSIGQFVQDHWPSITAGVIAAGSAGAAVYFHGSMNKAIETAKRTCAPDCSPAQLESITTAYTGRNIAIVASIAAAGAGITWEVLNNSEPSQTNESVPVEGGRTSLSVIPGFGNVAMEVRY